MRYVSLHEKRQRGCQYCKDVQFVNFGAGTRTDCPFFKCPYTVLDKYKTYDEFMASEDSKILVNEFFHTVASIYELSSNSCKTKCLFSDGDGRIGI